jgi:hypothetical protein
MIAVAFMGLLFGLVWHDRPARETVRLPQTKRDKSHLLSR